MAPNWMPAEMPDLHDEVDAERRWTVSEELTGVTDDFDAATVAAD